MGIINGISMSLVYLVGTNHWDLKGAERLRKLLNFIRPSAIGIEASEELINLRLSERQRINVVIEQRKQLDSMMSRMYGAIGKKEPSQKKDSFTLDFLVAQGYEIWASYEHQQEDNLGVLIYPIHDPEFLKRKSIKAYREALGAEAINQDGSYTKQFVDKSDENNSEEFQEKIDNSYFDNDRNLYKDQDSLTLIQECDDAMEPRIREVVSHNNGTGHVVIVAGSNHFFAEYNNNLYERLKDLSPTRVRLPDVDKF